MNLIIIAAFVAVCGAAKLDRTYLPPPLAKSAGGSPGSLQTPFSGNSFDQGAGALPKGSFTNDFQGVVVDAANPGTRASEGETALGGPRPSYGSTNSKVGDAAFRGSAAGFRFPTSQSQDGQDSDVQANTQVQAQGFVQGAAAPRFESKPERSQAAYDRVASTLRFENEVGPESFHYAYETENGISAEENGVATNGVQAQGGFSYTGDDGQVYTVTYTADEGGYQPRGDHLPTPPPIPDEILKSLEQNAKDEAAGVVDDGSYDAQKYNAEGDYAESDNVNVGHNDRQAPTFGKRPESDATASGSFINQNNQAFERPGPNGLPGQEDGSSNGAADSNNAFGPANVVNNFGQGSKPSHTQTANRFESRNEYLPPVNNFNQNGRLQRPTQEFNSAPSSQDLDGNTEQSRVSVNAQPQPQSQAQVNQGFNSNHPSKPSFGRPSSNRLDVLAQGAGEKPANNGFGPSSNSVNGAQKVQSTANFGNRFGSRNEYLPPINGFEQNDRPQRPTISADATAAQSFNQASQVPDKFQTNMQNSAPSTSPALVSESNTGAVDPSQQYNGFQQRPQHSNNQFSQSANRIPQNGKVPSNSGSFSAQRPTSQPSTELTTPFESNETPAISAPNVESGADVESSPNFNNFNSQPEQQFESNSNNGFGSQPKAPSSQPPNVNGQNAFPNHAQNQYRPFSSNNQQSESNNFNQNQPDDAQYSPSTVRPSFNQQSQGPDQSYYYRQPAKPFNTPSGSRFPSSPSNQFNRAPAHQNFPLNSFQPQQEPFRGSTKYPEPPTLASVAPTASVDGQFQGSTVAAQYNGITQASISPFQPQNGNSQGTTRYPRPPTVAPTSPTIQGFPSYFNGITQAAATAFTGAPTVPTTFNSQSSGSFGSRPNYQQTQFNQQSQFQPAAAQPNKASAQAAFTQQSQLGQGPSSSNQEPENSPSAATQQYNGEIYEYTKPAEGLPTTSNKEPAPAPQRGQSRPQFETTQINRDSSEKNSQQPTQTTFGSKPKFSQQSRPQFGGQFNAQSSASEEDQPGQDTKPQFNTQGRPFGAQPLSQQPLSGGRPQFSQKPNKCCQSLNAQIAQLESSQGSQNSGPSGSHFGAQFSGSDAQSASPSFAGRGEVFGGPRKPPSFDQETGYHY